MNDIMDILRNFSYEFGFTLLSSFLFTNLCLMFLYFGDKIYILDRFSDYFKIKSRKSSTNALLLGGLPVASVFLISTYFIIDDYQVNIHMNWYEIILIQRWITPALILIVYGYLDDKYELRPIVKLLSQLIAVFGFALMTSRILYPQNSTFAFVVIWFWGMGVVNGTNILDGLDSMLSKYSLITSFFYFGAGIYFSNFSLILLSLVLIGSFLGFLIFNKYPAKIHYGEIGGSFLGFCNILLSILLYKSVFAHTQNTLDALFFVLLPLNLPMVELGISFLRRIINGESPFRGDKFHIHYIIINYWGYSVPKTTNFLMASWIIVLGLSVVIAKIIGPFTAFLGAGIILVIGSSVIGRKYWFGEKAFHFSPRELFGYLLKQDVMIIDSSISDKFEIKIIEKEESEESEDSSKVA